MPDDALIAPVGFNETLQRVDRDVEFSNRFAQRYKIRVCRAGVAVQFCVTGVELLLPQIEQCQPVAVGLVAQVVDSARKGVNRIEVATEVFWEETRTDAEVFVMSPGQDFAKGERCIHVIGRVGARGRWTICFMRSPT